MGVFMKGSGYNGRSLMLAFAGVHRMGYDDMIQHKLPLDQFTPAVGQGSIAVEKDLISSSFIPH